MTGLVLECDGLICAGVVVPPFTVRAGDFLGLILPTECPDAGQALLDLFSGSAHSPAVRRFAPAALVERPMPRRRWWGLKDDPTVLTWLTRHARLAVQEAAAIVQRLGVSPDLRVGYLSWNGRTALALESLFTHPPGLIVLDTTGNDSTGIQMAYDLIRPRLSQCAAIHVTYWQPPYSSEAIYRRLEPGSPSEANHAPLSKSRLNSA